MTLMIARRFRGPPNSGNGGYSCGLIAHEIGPEATVTLRLPPPLETPLAVERDGENVRIFDGADLVAEAHSGADVPAPPDPVPFDLAEKIAAPVNEHPFPMCFVCGNERGPGDGLRIWPRPVPGRDLIAAPWIPDGSLDEDAVGQEFVWASLDCPGGWVPDMLGLGSRSVAVLGRLAARIVAPVHVGERCVLVAWPLGDDGPRKWFSGTALFGADGTLRALARSTWIVPR